MDWTRRTLSGMLLFVVPLGVAVAVLLALAAAVGFYLYLAYQFARVVLCGIRGLVGRASRRLVDVPAAQPATLAFPQRRSPGVVRELS
jgi:hypothetical protein